MNELKSQLQSRLIANVLMDKCATREHIIFKDSLCSQERVVRFTTVFCQKLIPILDTKAGKWKTGDQIMYEVENGADSCVVNCIYEPIGRSIFPEKLLKSWDISNADANALFDAFDRLLDETIPMFEQELEKKIKKEEFVEGGAKVDFTTKYERNPDARAACLAHHGYTCKICGLNFEETYGPEFKNIIEVHHIVPLSQIGKEYVVDPINDLIPVCPNCHTAVHRQADGISLDELKKKFNNPSK